MYVATPYILFRLYFQDNWPVKVTVKKNLKKIFIYFTMITKHVHNLYTYNLY